MKKLLSTAALVVAFVIAAAQLAAAQSTQTYMLVPGIPGDSVSARYPNWIDVLSLAQTYSGGNNRRSDACTVAVAKGLDRSGPLLWTAAVTGQIFPTVRIEITKAGGQQQRFYQLVLTNARVATISSSPSDLTEHLTIAGDSATLSYYPQSEDGSLDPPITATVTCSRTR